MVGLPKGPVIVFSSTGDGERTVRDLLSNGILVRALIDSRKISKENKFEIDNVEVFRGAKVIDTFGRKGITHVEIETEIGEKKKLECRLLHSLDRLEPKHTFNKPP